MRKRLGSKKLFINSRWRIFDEGKKIERDNYTSFVFTIRDQMMIITNDGIYASKGKIKKRKI